MQNNQAKYMDKSMISAFETTNKCWKKLDRPCQTFYFENVYILPSIGGTSHPYIGGVVDENKKIIEACKMLTNRQVSAYDFNKDDAKYDNREVIYIGCFWNHWGHFITDQMSRVYYLLKEENHNLPIAYIANQDFSEIYLEFFKLLGIDTERFIRITEPTKFKKVIIPEASFNFNTYYADEFALIYEKLRNEVKEDNSYPKKIFLSRAKFEKAENRDFGEIKEIEKFFENNGYTIIYPEQYSIKEQIKYFCSCDEMVATSGTISHNILFTKPNTKIIILNRSYIFNFMQATLNQIAKAQVINIDAQLSFFPQHIGIGPFYYHFSEHLIKWAEENNLKYEIPQDKNYLWEYLIGNHNLFKVISKKYYKPLSLVKNRPFFNSHLKKARGNFFIKELIKLYNFLRIIYFIGFCTKLFTKRHLYTIYTLFHIKLARNFI